MYFKKVIIAAFVCCLLQSGVGNVFAQTGFDDPLESGGIALVPDLQASKPTVDGGQLPLGGSAQIVALFKNSGTEPVIVGDINLYTSSSVTAQVMMNQCSAAPLTPGAECAITVEVSALQAGPWRVEVLVSHNGRSRLATTALTGTVQQPESGAESGPKDLVPTPKDIDFGSVAAGAPLVRSFILTNSTSRTLQINEIVIDASHRTGYDAESSCSVLEPGEGCIVKVRWTPSVKGVAEGLVSVNHNGPSRVLQVPLMANYQPESIDAPDPWPASAPGEGLLVADRTSLDFGASVDGAAAITVSLLNVGDREVVLDVIRLAGSDNGLSLARDGCRMGVVLPPTGACALTVNWLPRREGSVIDDVQILHSGARGVLVLPIRGTAQTPANASIKQTITKERDGEIVSTATGTPTMDGYTISSHALNKAVIAGPTGSRIVRDGETVVLEGYEWLVKIVPSGVELVSEFDRILLVFDRALSARTITTGGDTGPSTGATSGEETE